METYIHILTMLKATLFSGCDEKEIVHFICLFVLLLITFICFYIWDYYFQKEQIATQNLKTQKLSQTKFLLDDKITAKKLLQQKEVDDNLNCFGTQEDFYTSWLTYRNTKWNRELGKLSTTQKLTQSKLDLNYGILTENQETFSYNICHYKAETNKDQNEPPMRSILKHSGNFERKYCFSESNTMETLNSD